VNKVTRYEVDFDVNFVFLDRYTLWLRDGDVADDVSTICGTSIFRLSSRSGTSLRSIGILRAVLE
jgi:hypothetical protein